MPQESNLIHVSIPIPSALARQYLDLGRVMPAEILPAMLRDALKVEEPDPRELFTPLDKLIAAVVDEHGPVQAAEIVVLLEKEHGRITSEKVVHDRFGNKNNLKAAGYTRGENGYCSPSHDL